MFAYITECKQLANFALWTETPTGCVRIERSDFVETEYTSIRISNIRNSNVIANRNALGPTVGQSLATYLSFIIRWKMREVVKFKKIYVVVKLVNEK